MPSGIFEDEMPEKMSEVKRPEVYIKVEVLENQKPSHDGCIVIMIPRYENCSFEVRKSDVIESQTDGEYEREVIDKFNAYFPANVLSKQDVLHLQGTREHIISFIRSSLRNRPKKELDVQAVKDCLMKADLEWHKQPIVDDEANEFFYHMAKKVCQEFAPKKVDVEELVNIAIRHIHGVRVVHITEKEKEFFTGVCQAIADHLNKE